MYYICTENGLLYYIVSSFFVSEGLIFHLYAICLIPGYALDCLFVLKKNCILCWSSLYMYTAERTYISL